MLLKESAIFMSIGLPIAIAYMLAIISIIERRTSGETRRPYFPLRDACVAAIALDIHQVMAILEIEKGLIDFDNVIPSMLISLLMLAFHIGVLSFSKRLPESDDEDTRTLKLSVFRDMYLGLLCLMTNAVSLAALISMAGGAI